MSITRSACFMIGITSK